MFCHFVLRVKKAHISFVLFPGAIVLALFVSVVA
jgi:hypothetical protein